MTSPFAESHDQQGSMADATGLLPSSTSTPTSAAAEAYTNVLNDSATGLGSAAAATAPWSPVNSPTHAIHKDPTVGLQVPCLVVQASTGSSCTSTSNLSEAADGSQPSSASAVSAALQLFAGNTADEVQLMAARVLQRKNQAAGSMAAATAAEYASDPLLLLHSPEKSLRARKEQLMLLKANSSAAGQSARVAAAKEELAGVQARLRDALGLKEAGSDEYYPDYSQPPMRKRVSHDLSSCSSFESSADRFSASGGAGRSFRTRSITGQSTGAAPAFKQAPGQNPSATAAAPVAGPGPAAGAARAHVGGGNSACLAGLDGGCIYLDSASEVAEMAARVLRRHNTANSGAC